MTSTFILGLSGTILALFFLLRGFQMFCEFALGWGGPSPLDYKKFRSSIVNLLIGILASVGFFFIFLSYAFPGPSLFTLKARFEEKYRMENPPSKVSKLSVFYSHKLKPDRCLVVIRDSSNNERSFIVSYDLETRDILSIKGGDYINDTGL